MIDSPAPFYICFAIEIKKHYSLTDWSMEKSSYRWGIEAKTDTTLVLRSVNSSPNYYVHFCFAYSDLFKTILRFKMTLLKTELEVLKPFLVLMTTLLWPGRRQIHVTPPAIFLIFFFSSEGLYYPPASEASRGVYIKF